MKSHTCEAMLRHQFNYKPPNDWGNRLSVLGLFERFGGECSSVGLLVAFSVLLRELPRTPNDTLMGLRAELGCQQLRLRLLTDWVDTLICCAVTTPEMASSLCGWYIKCLDNGRKCDELQAISPLKCHIISVIHYCGCELTRL